jgi:hypothetical protein
MGFAHLPGLRHGLFRQCLNRLVLATFCACLVVLADGPAYAYLTFADRFPSPYTSYKWGPLALGTASGPVTWGYMADGTVPDPAFRIDPWGFPNSTGLSGGSNITQLRSRIDNAYGAGMFDTAIQNAFNTWSSVANITFVGPVADAGLPINDPNATTPMIRIGAFVPEAGHSFNYAAAVGFAPGPFNGGTLEGDILFNLNALFQIESGTEDVTAIRYGIGNDLEGLVLHELGHALGLDHASTGPLSVMYNGPGAYQYINRVPSIDDIAGIRRLYGPTPAPGDFDLDGDVDGADFVIWQTHFPAAAGGYLDVGDANNDGVVDGADFAAWQGSFPHAPSPGSSPVPEPDSLFTMLIAGIAVTGRVSRGFNDRRRSR